MFEKVGDEVRRTLRGWTERMMGPQRPRLEAINRPDNEFGVDPFGFDADYALAAAAPFLWLYKNYFRVETHGIENIPRGRVLLISNHSGQIPIDGAMIGVALLTECNPPRVVRGMVEKWVPSLPYISTVFARAGQIVGTPENCRRLLNSEEAVMVFPEGVRGISKLWPQRYHLQEFGLGFMRLALETNTPIVPVAVIGGEEQAPAIANLTPLAKLLGFPVLPVTLTGVPLPLPVKYRLYFGEPMTFRGRPDDDDAELEKKVRTVRTTIQSMIDQGLAARKHVFW